MLLKKFYLTIKQFVEEIGCLYSEEGYIGSHKIPSEFRIYDEDGNRYEIKNIEMNYLGGCGCPADIDMIIKLDQEE